MTWTNAFFDMVMALCAMWLMIRPKRSRGLPIIMAVIISGAVANVVEPRWRGALEIWPGELAQRGGMAFLLAWLIYQREQLGDLLRAIRNWLKKYLRNFRFQAIKGESEQ